MYEAQFCKGKNYIEHGRSMATLGVNVMKPFCVIVTSRFRESSGTQYEQG